MYLARDNIERLTRSRGEREREREVKRGANEGEGTKTVDCDEKSLWQLVADSRCTHGVSTQNENDVHQSMPRALGRKQAERVERIHSQSIFAMNPQLAFPILRPAPHRE